MHFTFSIMPVIEDIDLGVTNTTYDVWCIQTNDVMCHCDDKNHAQTVVAALNAYYEQ